MRRRNKGEPEKVRLEMASMIDGVFQLLVFFNLAFKIVSVEGQFLINMPVGEAAAAEPDLLPPLEVELLSDADGDLRSIVVGQKSIDVAGAGNADAKMAAAKAALRQLRSDLRTMFLPDDDSNEVKISASDNLKYDYVLQTVDVCAASYVAKINFTPPDEGDAP